VFVDDTAYASVGAICVNIKPPPGSVWVGSAGAIFTSSHTHTTYGETTLVDCCFVGNPYVVGSLWLYGVSVQHLDLMQSVGLCFGSCLIYQTSDIYGGGAALYCDGAYFPGGTGKAVTVRDGGTLVLEKTECSATGVVGYFAEVSCGSRIIMKDACSGLLGSLGAYSFTGVNPDQTHAAWPTVGVATTDSAGGLVVYSQT
jgi:hypothetical protein